MLKDMNSSSVSVEMDDESIIRRVLAGHKDCFRVLVSRYAGDVLRTVGRIVASQEDAEDVAQDAFVAVYESLAAYDSRRASFKTWMLRVAYYTALKRMRGKPSVSLSEVDLESIDTIPDADAGRLLGDASCPGRVALLSKAVEQLSAKDRMLLSLYYYDDRSIRDIAEVMDCTEGYLRSRLQWIRKKLCQIIKTLECDERE